MPEDIYYKVLAARLSLVLITLRQLEPVNQGLREEQLLGGMTGISLGWVFACLCARSGHCNYRRRGRAAKVNVWLDKVTRSNFRLNCIK